MRLLLAILTFAFYSGSAVASDMIVNFHGGGQVIAEIDSLQLLSGKPGVLGVGGEIKSVFGEKNTYRVGERVFCNVHKRLAHKLDISLGEMLNILASQSGDLICGIVGLKADLESEAATVDLVKIGQGKRN